MDRTRTYISPRNRDLVKRAILACEEAFSRPLPAHIPGQLSLFIEPPSLENGEPCPYLCAHD